jgi:hypothetical protein
VKAPRPRRLRWIRGSLCTLIKNLNTYPETIVLFISLGLTMLNSFFPAYHPFIPFIDSLDGTVNPWYIDI